ncbi:MAG: long-chain fatty acid--CoA ligase, partial [Deltaproteobacteria bacterium]
MSPVDKRHFEEIEITEDLTLPKLLVRIAQRYGERKVAIREKEFGIWRPITWADYLRNVREFALGLVSMGIQRGDKVVMIGDNRPEGLFAEMAAMSVGGVGVWLFQDSLIDEVQYIVDHSDAKFYVAEGQEEVDKALAIRDKCPKLKKIIWDDPKGMRHYDDPMLISFKEVQRLGRELDEKEPGLFEELLNQGKGEDICLLFYTSGTTALPKGALLTHYNMLK